MQLTLNRAELLSVMRDANQIAPQHTPVEILRGALLEAEDGTLKVTAGNLELTLERGMPANIQVPGSLVINARLFSSMLELLSGDVVSMSMENAGRAAVSCGSACYSVPVLNAKDYPRTEIPFPEDTVVVSNIPAMAQRTVFAAAENDDKPVLKCVNLIFSSNGLHIAGSDGFRVAFAKGVCKGTGTVSMLMPAASLSKLEGLVSGKDELTVGTTGKNIVFTKPGFTFSARLMEGRFPNTEQFLSSISRQFTVLTDTEALRKAVSTVIAVAEEDSKLLLHFAGGQVHFSCGSSLGVSRKALDVLPLSGTPQGAYWYNPRQLYECLRAQSGTLLLEMAQSGVMLLRTDELVCMQSAVRPPASARAVQLPQAEVA